MQILIKDYLSCYLDFHLKSAADQKEDGKDGDGAVLMQDALPAGPDLMDVP